MFFNRQIPLVLALIFLCLNSANAAVTDWQKSPADAVSTRLLASFYDDNGTKKLIGGIEFKINSGWKIYGNDAGGIGMVPNFDFSGSQNYLAHHLIWPEPERHAEKIGNETFHYSAYHHDIILPFEIDLKKIEDPINLQIALEYGACRDVCIPIYNKFSLTIPNEIDPIALQEIAKFYPHRLLPKDEIVISDKQPEKEFPIIFYSIFALIGGLILNVMPCVLPVLSIKMMSIINKPSARMSSIRLAFFATTLGIIFCFLIFAALACLIKFTGNEFGWGLQFQNPSFLIFLIIVTTFFTANLLGKFEITFEQFLTSLLNRKINEGESRHIVFLPNFLSGILATLLATPCSAPFLGSAISFALVQNFQEIFIIFFFIGVGFASPYIILSFFPKLVYHLPKPGSWMLKLKQTLALLMFATLLWLLFILSHNLGSTATILVLLLTLLMFFTFKIGNRIIRFSTLILLFFIAFTLPKDFEKPASTTPKKGELISVWQEFNEDEIHRQVQAGKVVLVDVTADWCLTCKFNKINVLQSREIASMLDQQKIIGMRGDITKPDLKIMEFMRLHNRFAIPFNVVYGPKAPNGLLASELLTKKELIKLIEQAQ